MTELDAAPVEHPEPRTVAVPPPTSEPVSVVPRTQRKRAVAASVPAEPDPDIPFAPLPPGAFMRHLADQPGEVGERAREELAAADGAPPPAVPTVADAVPALRRLLADPNASAADVAALVLALSRVSDAARDAPASKPLCELTHAELVQRVSECDTRRAQLLAAIAAAGAATPPGGGDARG